MGTSNIEGDVATVFNIIVVASAYITARDFDCKVAFEVDYPKNSWVIEVFEWKYDLGNDLIACFDALLHMYIKNYIEKNFPTEVKNFCFVIMSHIDDKSLGKKIVVKLEQNSN